MPKGSRVGMKIVLTVNVPVEKKFGAKKGRVLTIKKEDEEGKFWVETEAGDFALFGREFDFIEDE